MVTAHDKEVPTVATHDMELPHRILNYLRLIRSTSDFGTITLDIRHGLVVYSEVTVRDNRKLTDSHSRDSIGDTGDMGNTIR